MTMKKKQMNAAIDPALAERIRLIVEDPDFPLNEEIDPSDPKKLVRAIWKKTGLVPETQSLFLLWRLAASELYEFAALNNSEDGVEYALLREYANGFWDRSQALESPRDTPVLHRFHLYADIFDLDEDDLKVISDKALETVEASKWLTIDYRSWQVAQGLAA